MDPKKNKKKKPSGSLISIANLAAILYLEMAVEFYFFWKYFHFGFVLWEYKLQSSLNIWWFFKLPFQDWIITFLHKRYFGGGWLTFIICTHTEKFDWKKKQQTETIVYLTVEETIYKDNYITKEFNDKNIQKKEEYLWSPEAELQSWAPLRNTGQRVACACACVSPQTKRTFYLHPCVYFHVRLTTTYGTYVNDGGKQEVDVFSPSYISACNWTGRSTVTHPPDSARPDAGSVRNTKSVEKFCPFVAVA